jgi:tetratricopeptide (TPR) repeat protein
MALAKKGLFHQAIAEFQKTFRLKGDSFQARHNLGWVLWRMGRRDQAIEQYRKAAELRKDSPQIWITLATALVDNGDLKGAIDAYQQAIKLKSDDGEAHFALGRALYFSGRREEALKAYRAAIKYKPDLAEAHCNLGILLKEMGQFRQAVKALRRGHELGSRRGGGWTYPSAGWLREGERLAELQERVPAVLAGKDRPRNAGESLGFAQICQLAEKRYARAAQFYAEAFRAEPKLAENLNSGYRYDAACAAALAGGGEDKDEAVRNAETQAQLRRQALDWLRADLNTWNKFLANDPDRARLVIVRKMRHWLADLDLDAVRDPAALARLPGAERPAWQTLWADVIHTLTRAKQETASKKKSDPK